MKFFTIAIAFFFLTPASNAQSVALMVQSELNRNGQGCEAVTRIEPIGTTNTGDAIIAAACSGGETYALRINDDNTLSFISNCAIFFSSTNVRCFS